MDNKTQNLINEAMSEVNDQSVFTEDQIQLLQGMVYRIGLAIQRKRISRLMQFIHGEEDTGTPAKETEE